MEFKTTNNNIDAYMDSINGYALLTAKEERKLAAQLHNGSAAEKAEAKNKLITSNLKLVVAIADDYKNCCASFYDLIAAGNERLVQIVEDFDPLKFKTRFSTFAYIRIKDAILKEVNDFFNYTKQVRSFEEPVSEDSEITLEETLECSNSKEWWEESEKAEQLKLLKQVMQKLDEREQKILKNYYLEGKKLAEIAEELALSRQRVSQLCERAF